MSRTARRLVAIVAALVMGPAGVVSLTGPSLARAQDGAPVAWQSGSFLTTTRTPYQPMLAQVGDRTVAVWSDWDGLDRGKVELHAAERSSRTAPWGGRTVLSTDSPFLVDLASGSGHAVVAWTQVVSDSEESLRARVLAPGGGWGPPAELARVPRVGSFRTGVVDLEATVLASGEPLVVWGDDRSKPGEPGQPYELAQPVQAKRWQAATGGWGPLEQVETNPGGHPLTLSSTPSGSALLGYGSGGNYFVYERGRDGVWSPRQDLMPQEFSGAFLPEEMRLVTNARGTSVAVWSLASDESPRYPGGRKVFMASRGPGGAWTSPRVLAVASDVDWHHRPSLTLGPQDGFTVVLLEPAGAGSGTVDARHLDASAEPTGTSRPRGVGPTADAFEAVGGPEGVTVLYQAPGASSSTRTLLATRLTDLTSRTWSSPAVLSRDSEVLDTGDLQPASGREVPAGVHQEDGGLLVGWAERARVGFAGSAPVGATDPAPQVVPAVTVSPAVVRYGETAQVTVSGAPGAVVDLYTRKFGGGFVKIRDGLLLDAAGRTVVLTRPDMNLRFQARDRAVEQASSVGGGDGLMTVQKSISLGVRRVGARRYAFAGSISPAHPGATVSIYGNGTLLASGVPVSSTRSFTFTATLPSGTYAFQARTATSGYNQASSSPVRSVRVS